MFELYEKRLIGFEEAIRNADSANELRLNIKLRSKRGEPSAFGDSGWLSLDMGDEEAEAPKVDPVEELRKKTEARHKAEDEEMARMREKKRLAEAAARRAAARVADRAAGIRQVRRLPDAGREPLHEFRGARARPRSCRVVFRPIALNSRPSSRASLRLPPSPLTPTLPRWREQIGFAQCVLALKSVLMTTPVGWLLVAWFAWARAPHANVLVWLGGFFCSWIVALALLRSIVRAGAARLRHARRLLAIAILDGVSWGAMAWLIVGYSATLDPWLGAVLCGVAAVNAPVYITYLPRLCRADGLDLGHR